MDENKVNKIQEAILANPEIHTQLIGALRALLNEVGEAFTADELFHALKSKTDKSYAGGCTNTYEEFWAHYK
jgi:hypothetical protein